MMKSDEFTSDVTRYRLTFLFLILLSFIFKQQLDDIITDIYQKMSITWWFNHDSFEPMWAVICFFTWIGIYKFIDYFLLPQLSIYLINPKNRVTEPYKDTIFYIAGFAYLAPIIIYDIFVPRRTLPLEAPSFHQIMMNLSVTLFLYDLFFYPVHYLFHKGPEFIRNFHQAHHETQPLVAIEVLRLSFIDGSLQVLTNIFVINLLKLHPLTRMFWNAFITYLLTEIHSGYDMPWMLHNILPKGVLGGPRRHELHHKNGRVNYHQFFTYLDDWLGHGSDNLKA